MSTYKKMYYKLFNKITDIMDQLQRIQQETEEIFVSHEEMVKKAESEEMPDSSSTTTCS